MDKKKALLLLSTVLMIASIFINPLSATAESSISQPLEGESPTSQGVPAQGLVDKLILQNRPPWGYASNENAIVDNGFGFAVVDTTTFPGTDLSQFKVIILAGAQNSTYYAAIGSDPIRSKLASFVGDGGVLLAHMAAQSQGDEPVTIDLPGAPGLGVGVVPLHPFQDVSVADPTHPIMNGPFGTVTDANMDNWNWTSHGHFTNLPIYAHLIMVEGPTAPHPGQPTYVSWRYKRGIVVATRSPLEWGYGYVGGANGKRPLQNEIAFAQAYIPPESIVGGTIISLNMLELLAPLIGIVAMIASATGVALITKRRN